MDGCRALITESAFQLRHWPGCHHLHDNHARTRTVRSIEHREWLGLVNMFVDRVRCVARKKSDHSLLMQANRGKRRNALRNEFLHFLTHHSISRSEFLTCHEVDYYPSKPMQYTASDPLWPLFVTSILACITLKVPFATVREIVCYCFVYNTLIIIDDIIISASS